MRVLDRAFHDLALCHLLIAAALGLALLRLWLPVAGLSLVVGLGGLGAAWGRDTEDGHDWLSLDGAFHPPSGDVLRCALEHAPFAVLGACVLIGSVR